MPINFDLAMGFPLLFHLQKVSFANKTLQVAKVNTSLLVSLLRGFPFGHNSKYE